jgi:antitoxin HigA-1
MPRQHTRPGEVLREEYVLTLGLSARTAASSLGVPADWITKIMRGKRRVTADTAMRLARYFRTDPRFWLKLQTAHDISKARVERDHPETRRRPTE